MGNKEGGSRRPFFFSPWQRENCLYPKEILLPLMLNGGACRKQYEVVREELSYRRFKMCSQPSRLVLPVRTAAVFPSLLFEIVTCWNHRSPNLGFGIVSLSLIFKKSDAITKREREREREGEPSPFSFSPFFEKILFWSSLNAFGKSSKEDMNLFFWWIKKKKFYRKGDMWKVDSEISNACQLFGRDRASLSLLFRSFFFLLVGKKKPKKNRSWAGLRKKR